MKTTLQALFQSTTTGVVVQDFRSFSLPVTYIIHAELSGSGPHELITLSLIQRTEPALPLAAVSRSTSIISLRLDCIVPPFPHRFQVPVTLVPTVQPFCPASLVF